VCACVVALALAAPAASLAARPSQDFFGIAAWTPPSPAEFERMGRARLGVYRTTMLWSVVEQRRGRRDWRYYDDLIARSSRAGMTLLPTLVGSPRFAAPRETSPPRGGAPMRRWLGFVRAAVNRYGRRGTIWKRNPSLPYRPIRAWQVWNEPNFPSWWRGRPNARQYTRFLARSRGAIRRGDRRATVVLAGLPESPLGIPMKRFLPALYRAGARRLFDAVAVHAYARNHRGALAVVERARAIMRRNGDRRKPIWVTEMGWATGGQVSRRTGAFTTTPAGQAARVTQTFRAFIRARKRLRIGMIVWFSWRDRLPIAGERDWWGLHTGLFDVNGNPKPAWPALVRQTGGDPSLATPAPLPGLPDPPPGPPPGGGGGGGGGDDCPLIVVCP
jgi:Glycosyl hydrolase catalytic core